MIDITFPDLFKGDDLLYTRRFDIIAIQYEKKSGDNIGGSLVAIHKTAIAGQTETIPSEIHANEERSGFHRGGSRLFDVRPLALTSTTDHRSRSHLLALSRPQKTIYVNCKSN